MATFEKSFKKDSSSTFCKLMGCGSGDGFNLSPDYSCYVLINCWNNEDDCRKSFSESKVYQKYLSKTCGYQQIYLKNCASHGTWDGSNPFVTIDQYSAGETIAVITRATIRWKEIFRFRKYVMPVVRNMFKVHNPVFAIGIGEFPLRYQATFSIWSDLEKLKNFAYKDQNHGKVIKETHRSGWYSEDLFARFTIYNVEGEDISGYGRYLDQR